MSGAHLERLSGKTVLIAEDNDDDLFFVKKACEAAGVPHSLITAGDGQAAIDYLMMAMGGTSRSLLPDLIVLDIKLPRVDGHQVLEWLRGQAALKHLPVMMFTSSMFAKDVSRAYGLGATSYFVKTANREDLYLLFQTALQYWLLFNCLPQQLPGAGAGPNAHEAEP